MDKRRPLIKFPPFIFSAVREDRMPGGRNSGAVYNMYKVKEIRLLINLTHMLISVVSDEVSVLGKQKKKSLCALVVVTISHKI